jgi:hypothetical protein
LSENPAIACSDPSRPRKTERYPSVSISSTTVGRRSCDSTYGVRLRSTLEIVEDEPGVVSFFIDGPIFEFDGDEER